MLSKLLLFVSISFFLNNSIEKKDHKGVLCTIVERDLNEINSARLTESGLIYTKISLKGNRIINKHFYIPKNRKTSYDINNLQKFIHKNRLIEYLDINPEIQQIGETKSININISIGRKNGNFYYNSYNEQVDSLIILLNSFIPKHKKKFKIFRYPR